jgi:LysM repeat protein
MRRRRSPVRWLVPIALVACVVAVYSVVNATLLADDDGATTPASQTSTSKSRTTAKGKTTKSRSKRRRAYTVKAGDTLSSISAKTGVSLARIQDLNPELDSQALQTGQRIKLSP